VCFSDAKAAGYVNDAQVCVKSINIKTFLSSSIVSVIEIGTATVVFWQTCCQTFLQHLWRQVFCCCRSKTMEQSSGSS